MWFAIKTYIYALYSLSFIKISDILEKCQPGIIEYIVLYNQVKSSILAKYKDLCRTNSVINAIHVTGYFLYDFITEKIGDVHDMCFCNWRVPKDGSWRDCCIMCKKTNEDWAMIMTSTNCNYYSQYGINYTCKNLVKTEQLYIYCDENGNYQTLICKEKDLISEIATEPKYNESVVASRVKFLVVEYSHPKMKNTIEIKIDPKMLVVGNAILSPCFVWRYLAMLPIYKSFVFDLNYKLTIIDNCATTIELDSIQYIVLGNFDYKICSMQEVSQKS